MYSIDEVPLDNPWLGWAFMRASRPVSGHSAQRTALRVAGVPGVVANLENTLESLDAVTLTLVVQTPRRNYAALTGLLVGGSTLTREDQPGRSVTFEFLGASPEGRGPADEVITVTASIRLPGVFWRDRDQTTPDVDLTAASVVFEPWRMDGLVTDAILRVRGTTGLEITSGTAHIAYATQIPAGSYLRYHCATGRAYLTTSDTWSGGTEVSGSVDDDGPGEKFGIFPARISPLDWTARMTITTTARATGARLEVRGRPAYLV